MTKDKTAHRLFKSPGAALDARGAPVTHLTAPGWLWPQQARREVRLPRAAGRTLGNWLLGRLIS